MDARSPYLERSPCYILRTFFSCFLWQLYAPAQVNGGLRNFYTWWNLSVNEKLLLGFFFWSSLNYRVGQKVTKFGIFSDPHKPSALTPERGRILSLTHSLVDLPR